MENQNQTLGMFGEQSLLAEIKSAQSEILKRQTLLEALDLDPDQDHTYRELFSYYQGLLRGAFFLRIKPELIIPEMTHTSQLFTINHSNGEYWDKSVKKLVQESLERALDLPITKNPFEHDDPNDPNR